jgi:hypothetical protein
MYSFPRDADGVYNSEGDISKVDTKLHVRYATEGRFLVWCCRCEYA